VAVAAAHDQIGADLRRAREDLLADAGEIDLAMRRAGDTVRR